MTLTLLRCVLILSFTAVLKIRFLALPVSVQKRSNIRSTVFGMRKYRGVHLNNVHGFWKGEIVSIGMIINLMRTGIFQVFILAAPILLAALVVGLIIAIFQATTSIQEQTLTFVPKILTILGMLALLGGWMSGILRDYTIRLFEIIPQLVQG